MGALIGVGIFFTLFIVIAGLVFVIDYVIDFYEKEFGE